MRKPAKIQEPPASPSMVQRCPPPRRPKPREYIPGVARIALATAVALALWPAALADSHPGHGPVGISIGEFAYAPAKVTILAGDYVLWDWAGPDTNHSATADSGQALSF